MRKRSDSFSDHFSQARLFFQSQSEIEQLHIIKAISFELSKVKDEKIREREVAILNQIDSKLASEVAKNLNIIPSKELDEMTLKFVRQNHSKNPLKGKVSEVEKSKPLSMQVKDGERTIETRKVAFLVADGVSKKAWM